MSTALEACDILTDHRRREVHEKLGIDDRELESWDAVSCCRLRVPFHDRVISQFEGYGELEELDWEAYRARWRHLPTDRIPEAEGDSTDRYRLSSRRTC